MSRRYQIASESSVIVYFGNTIDPLISKEVQKAYQALKANVLEGFYEIIPSYASLMVSYDVMRFDFHEVCKRIEKIIHHAEEITMSEPKIVTIPVYYGLEVGLDLELLAYEKNLSVEEIIALHTQELYSVYAIGFAPGFAIRVNTETFSGAFGLDSARYLNIA